MTVAATLHLRKPAGWVVAAALIGIGVLTLTPAPPAASPPHYCLICGSFGTVDALLNVLLFIPLGVGLALAGVPARWAVLVMCGLSVGIELAQLGIPGRDSTIGDVVFNSLGGALGYLLVRRRRQLVSASPRAAARLAMGFGILWLVAQAAFAFALKVNLTTREYYMQIGHVLGGFDVFDGTVQDVRIAGAAIPDSLIVNTRAVEAALLRGDPLMATVTARQVPARIAPIVRIADEAREEIALVGQQSENLVFSLRTGATALRLRRPFFALVDAIPVTRSTASPVRLLVAHHERSVDLQSRTSTQTKTVQIPVKLSLAWTLFLPFQWFIGGSYGEEVLGFLWTACLLIPFGYWTMRSKLLSAGDGARRLLAAAITAVFLILGLALIPRLIGVAPATSLDWVAALLGVSAGATAARRLVSSSARDPDVGSSSR